MFSRSKAASWRSGESTWRAQAVLAGLGRCGRRAWCAPGRASTTDGRWMLGDVAVPVDDAGVEAERRAWSSAVERVPQGEQPVDAVDGLALGVGAVELDVAEGPLGLLALLLERGAPLGLLAPQRQGAEHASRPARAGLWARVSWPCTRPRPGNDHSGTTMGWPLAS